MGKKSDINAGAGMTAVVVAILVGIAAGSFWIGVLALFGLIVLLSALRIIR